MTASALRSATSDWSVSRPRILCVDDEPNVLAGLKLLLGREYEVHVADNGQAGLDLLQSLGSIPVVISDMRMPGMSGAEFLEGVAACSALTARVLLTGAADMEAAAEAVNKGDLFRLLIKPCPADQLRATLTAAVELHSLRSAEQDLLERTLIGSIRALTEVLGIADPVAFGRIGQIKQLALAVATRLGLPDRWQVEYAAMMCQIGNISLQESTAKKLYGGQSLTMQERIQVEEARKLGPAIIRHIPRLEHITRVLEELAAPRRPDPQANESATAKILRAVTAFESLERTSKTRAIAIQAFVARRHEFDVGTANALLETLGAVVQDSGDGIEIGFTELRPGMVTAAEYRSVTGALLVPNGTEITPSLYAKLMNFPRQQLMRIRVKRV
jgi:response regulator RpfG family c-di-GMP phosphodiesterase